MKFDDLKWAVGELVSAALRRPHSHCDCHPRLTYREPGQEPEAPARRAAIDRAAREDTVRSAKR